MRAKKSAFQLPAKLVNIGGVAHQQLPAQVQQKMESFFGSSFSDVRVHVGPQAASIGALAFTHGSDIYFAPGQYNPTTPRGQQLLGHELTHVLQQRAGRVRNPFGSGVAVVVDHQMEAEADRKGRQAARHQISVQTRTSSGNAQQKATSNFSRTGRTGASSHCVDAGTGFTQARANPLGFPQPQAPNGRALHELRREMAAGRSMGNSKPLPAQLMTKATGMQHKGPNRRVTSSVQLMKVDEKGEDKLQSGYLYRVEGTHPKDLTGFFPGKESGSVWAASFDTGTPSAIKQSLIMFSPQSGGSFLYRFPMKGNEKGGEDIPEIYQKKGVSGGKEYKINYAVPSSQIEVSVGGKWHPVTKYTKK